LSAIESNIDAWITEYLALPENSWDWDGQPGSAFHHMQKGRPRFQTYDDLAQWVTCWLLDHDLLRVEELKADQVGILLRHREHEQARTTFRNDWGYVNIRGDKYMLTLAPAVAYGETAPTLKELVLPRPENA
jgi:hypothetical protein